MRLVFRLQKLQRTTPCATLSLLDEFLRGVLGALYNTTAQGFGWVMETGSWT
jgi:hypothetical protein